MICRHGPSPATALGIFLLASLLLLTLLNLHQGSGSAPPPPVETGPRVLLIGLDAADWIMLDRWFQEGELPNLNRLAESGLRGDLRTLRPIISPLVWTSIATGQPPDRHGVTDFFSGGDSRTGLRPVSRAAIQVPTMWDTLSSLGLEVTVTAWWASWPADPTINGRVVTDQVQFAFPGQVLGPESEDALYHPPELADRLEPCLVSPGMITPESVNAIAPCTAADLAPESEDQAPALLRRVMAATATYYRMTRQMLREDQADFTAVYFLGTDTVAHLYGRAGPTDPGHQALLRYYRLVDAMVGDLCAQAESHTLVVLVSDHGFYTGEDRPSGDSSDFHNQAAGWHRPLGMVLFNAPWIKAGRLDDASVLDIAPTLLWQLLGRHFDSLPGRVLVEERQGSAVTPLTLLSNPAPTTLRPAVDRTGETQERYLDQLRALGYLEEDGTGDRSLGTRPAIHLADYLQWSGQQEKALAQLEQAVEQYGMEPRLLARLAIQRSRANDPQGALDALTDALDLGWNPAAAGQLGTAVGIFCAAGRTGQAEILAGNPLWQTAAPAQAATARALVAEFLGRTREAVDQYVAILAADPASGQATRGVCRLMAPKDTSLIDLSETVLRAARLRTGDTPVQLNAGRLLLAVGDPDAALESLRRAVHLEPDLPDQRLLLGRALYQSGRPAEAHERLAEGLAWHPSHPGLLTAAGAAALRAGYMESGTALLERARAAGAHGPQIEAALDLARQRSGR